MGLTDGGKLDTWTPQGGLIDLTQAAVYLTTLDKSNYLKPQEMNLSSQNHLEIYRGNYRFILIYFSA